MRTLAFVAAASVTVAACSQPRPTDPVPVRSSPPAASSSTAATAPAPTGSTASPKTTTFRATVAMAKTGTVDAAVLVSRINDQLGPMQPCAPLVRAADAVVGSLNLEVTIGDKGAAKVDLQSPVSVEAGKCIAAAAASWSFAGLPPSQSMVLLSLRDTP